MMNLIEKSYEPCVLMTKGGSKPDGEGGFIIEWIDSVQFECAITFDTSMESRIAQKQGVKSRYTITTNKNAKLEYNDVIRRLSDGKIFRVTSDGNDKQTPESASFQVLQVTAEEWVLE